MTAEHDPHDLSVNPRRPRAVLGAWRSTRPLDPQAARTADVLSAQAAWLEGRARRTAYHYRLDGDDLFQEVVLSLLRRTSSTLDEANDGVRTWLGNRTVYTARDMWRSNDWGARGRTEAAEVGRLALIESAAADEDRWFGQARIDYALDIHFLVERRDLTAHEAQTVALVCSGAGYSLREFAAAIGRSYTGVRKEHERALRKIENCFGLTPDEDVVLRMVRQHGSVSAAAAVLHRAPYDVRHVGESATKKITTFFDGPEGTH